MNPCEYYVLVDFELNQIIDKIQKLPENWNNICGLPRLTDTELSNLEWAGHKNLGWINFCSESITKYKFSNENLELNKNQIKSIISSIRDKKQQEPIEYKEKLVKSNKESLCILNSIKDESFINYKCVNGYLQLSTSEIIEIFNLMRDKFQYYFNLETELYDKIDKCTTIYELSRVNYDF